MLVGEIEIERVAQALIVRYGAAAAREAALRLNQMIDRADWAGRDRWACIVRAIHEHQGAAPVFARDIGRAPLPPPA